MCLAPSEKNAPINICGNIMLQAGFLLSVLLMDSSLLVSGGLVLES